MGQLFPGWSSHTSGERAREARVRRWAIGMVLLALAGVAASWLAARRTSQTNAQRSHAVFTLAAAQVTANMNLDVQHETDLLTGAAAFMREHPGHQPLVFRRWTGDIRAVKRYPELIALAEIQPPLRRGSCPAVTFAGPIWITRFAALGSRSICTDAADGSLATNSGVSIFGLNMVGMRFLAEDEAVYRTVTVPPTAAARRREFLGDAALALYPEVLLRRALAGVRNVGIELRTTGQGASLTFSAGPRVHGQSQRYPLSNGLDEIVTGRVQGGSILDDRTATTVLLGGSTVSILLALALFLLGTGRARAMRLVHEKTGELAFQALHDGLTGLPNRILVTDRIDRALARSVRGAPPVALLFIDADGFKTVNDTFGHAAGDQLLRVIASRLADAVRDADTVGRLGGDEFVVLLESGEGRPSPELVAERILELVARPVDLDNGVEVRLTTSIGIAVGSRETTEELVRDADLALYAAKRSGKNRYVVFEDTMRTAIADRHALEIDLRQAVARNELFLVYQPTFRLDDRRIVGVEALVRWQHPTRGPISPDTFIPIAEDSGLILEIGRWVAREACAQAAAWRDRGLAVTMAINVSGKQLDEKDFIGEICAVLDETELDPEALTLEITESSLMRDPHEAAARLEQLKTLGVRIAIDDFGTGYSSLAYLREFPVDSLKIDRTFISGLEDSEDAAAMLATLVQLGKTLKISTLGEGIEDESQLERLRDAQCDYGQGFVLARPLPAEQIEAIIIDDRPSPGSISSAREGADAMRSF